MVKLTHHNVMSGKTPIQLAAYSHEFTDDPLVDALSAHFHALLSETGM
jgi:hypothetical protein